MGIRESTWGSLLAVAVGVYAAPLAAADHQDLLELSLEQLMQLEVTDVITHAEKREAYSQNVPFSLSIVEPNNLYSPLLNSIQHVDQRAPAERRIVDHQDPDRCHGLHGSTSPSSVRAIAARAAACRGSGISAPGSGLR